jgi:hypothetical protein
MPSYKCNLCEYFTTSNSNYNKHLKTKKHRLNEEKASENENKLKPMSQNEPKMSQNEPQMSQNEPEICEKTKKKFNCDFCNDSFNTMANKRRHENYRCKENTYNTVAIIKNKDIQIKKLEEEMSLQKKEMKKELEQEMKLQRKQMERDFAKQKKEMMKQIELLLTKVGDTTINNTNNNNIQINNYGSEDISHITDKIKTELLKIPFGAVPKLIEYIHFNIDKPENKNIKINNIRDNKVCVFQNGEWVYKNKKIALMSMIDDKYYILDDHYNQLDDEKLSNFNKNNYKNFSDKYDNEDKGLLKKMYEETEMLILNN